MRVLVISALALIAACKDDGRGDCGAARRAFEHAIEPMAAAPAVEGSAEQIARSAAAQADAMQEVHDRFAAARLDGDQLRAFFAEYAAIAARKVVNLRQMQAAGERGDMAAFDQAVQDGRRDEAAEDALTERLTRHCGF